MIKYKLEPKETKKFEGKSGIYGIVYDQDIIYVGQSKNIGRRLREHGKENKLNDENKIDKTDLRNNIAK